MHEVYVYICSGMCLNVTLDIDFHYYIAHVNNIACSGERYMHSHTESVLYITLYRSNNASKSLTVARLCIHYQFNIIIYCFSPPASNAKYTYIHNKGYAC